MRILGLILCAGLCAVPSAAKLKVSIGVDFSDESLKSEIKSGIAARFNSTERYTVTESEDTDVFVHVICVLVKLKDASHNLGVACAVNTLYFPFRNSLTYPIAGPIITATPERLQSMIGDFADYVINATTDETLADYRKTVTTSIQLTCLNVPKICTLPPQPKQ